MYTYNMELTRRVVKWVNYPKVTLTIISRAENNYFLLQCEIFKQSKKSLSTYLYRTRYEYTPHCKAISIIHTSYILKNILVQCPMQSLIYIVYKKGSLYFDSFSQIKLSLPDTTCMISNVSYIPIALYRIKLPRELNY